MIFSCFSESSSFHFSSCFDAQKRVSALSQGKKRNIIFQEEAHDDIIIIIIIIPAAADAAHEFPGVLDGAADALAEDEARVHGPELVVDRGPEFVSS